MKILHTADWHLGKKLDNYSRLEEQRVVLEEIVQIAKDQEVDMVIVAGDLYDNFTPSNEATELLYKTLKRLANNGKVPVIAIAGNHDSPDRVNVADVLARESGIILIGSPMDVVSLFSLEDGFEIQKSGIGFIEIKLPQFDYPVRILHTAFANEVRLKEYFGEDKQVQLQESLSQKWHTLAEQYCDVEGVNVLVTHLYMLQRGGAHLQEPEGERPLNIGNADVVYSDAIPNAIQYAALGHLHRYQNIGTHQPVIYSSSILPYSFSEAGQKKYVVIIDIEPGSAATFEPIEIQSGKRLERKTFNNISNALAWLQAHQDELVELTIQTDEYLKSEERKQLYQSHPGIIRMIPEVKNLKNEQSLFNEIDLKRNDVDLFKDYFKSKNNGQEPNQEILDLLKEIMGQ
ncbi:MAG TPA: exonuclease SbcCD subunit D [Edaphocola sp.]|nr:exonuclease SbcCD subunit D [Edaphocola sp.]